MTAQREIKDHLIIALDTSSENEALTLVEKLKDYAGYFKVGHELFTSVGPKIFNDFQADFILCPAGKVNVDWVEENPKEAWNNNVLKLNVLFECAAQKDIPVVFFSTDYIFDGNNGPYSEEAIPNPINYYGMQNL